MLLLRPVWCPAEDGPGAAGVNALDAWARNGAAARRYDSLGRRVEGVRSHATTRDEKQSPAMIVIAVSSAGWRICQDAMLCRPWRRIKSITATSG